MATPNKTPEQIAAEKAEAKRVQDEAEASYNSREITLSSSVKDVDRVLGAAPGCFKKRSVIPGPKFFAMGRAFDDDWTKLSLHQYFHDKGNVPTFERKVIKMLTTYRDECVILRVFSDAYVGRGKYSRLKQSNARGDALSGWFFSVLVGRLHDLKLTAEEEKVFGKKLEEKMLRADQIAIRLAFEMYLRSNKRVLKHEEEYLKNGAA
jgi:hypothetical protein